jgi:hypothetical protein
MSVNCKQSTRRVFGWFLIAGARFTLRWLIPLALLALLIAPRPVGGVEAPTPQAGGSNGEASGSGGTIEFAGREWNVKSGCGMGPGPNCWSDSEESVWVDGQGLHLKIREIDETWHSAEVWTTSCSFYGMHRFYLVGRPDQFDKNVVLGLFLYGSDDRELDIEFAKWGEETPATNAQYVVQPWDKEGNREPFLMALNGTHSTHSIDWRPSEVLFESLHGHNEPARYVIHEWAYRGEDIPPAWTCLPVHINLWLYVGNPPSDGQEVEITVRNVELPDPLAGVLLAPTVLSQDAWITVAAEGDQAWGRVGPSSLCNDNYKVALYAKTDIWYQQPRCDSRSTIPIHEDCTWRSSTHGWDQVAAHLVPVGYEPPCTIRRTSNCPPPPLDPGTDPDVLAASCTP